MKLFRPKNKKFQEVTFGARQMKKTCPEKNFMFREMKLSSRSLKNLLIFQEGTLKSQTKKENFFKSS